jgi:serine/threonine protein kinase
MSLLKQLHDTGYIQRDLRLSNILKAADGSLKLVDLESVMPHKCSLQKRRGVLLRLSVGRQCAELVKIAKYFQIM